MVLVRFQELLLPANKFSYDTLLPVAYIACEKILQLLLLLPPRYWSNNQQYSYSGLQRQREALAAVVAVAFRGYWCLLCVVVVIGVVAVVVVGGGGSGVGVCVGVVVVVVVVLFVLFTVVVD